MTWFTKTKPTAVGVYMVRGWYIGRPHQTAIASVERNGDGELVCNLHEIVSDHHVDEWDTLDQFASDFEWAGPMVYVPPGKGNDPRVNDDSFLAALEAARSNIGPLRPESDEPEDQWYWDKLTFLMEILGAEEP